MPRREWVILFNALSGTVLPIDKEPRQALLRTVMDMADGKYVGGVRVVRMLEGLRVVPAQQFAQVVNELITVRILADDEFAAYVGLLSIHYDHAPKVPAHLV